MRKWIAGILFLLMLLGFYWYAAPIFRAEEQKQKIQQTVTDFREQTNQVQLPIVYEKEEDIAEIPFASLLEAIESYNLRIFSEGQAGLRDKQSYEQPVFYLPEYGIESNIFGVITIPAIQVELPIYLGASDENLMLGACVLGETSIPVGGTNQNAVIAGHRGWDGVGYFVDIDKLQLDDEIIIQNPWEELHYHVTDIKIIQPDDIEAILIQNGKDLVTLLSCHPFRSGGKQRYLVICERCE